MKYMLLVTILLVGLGCSKSTKEDALLYHEKVRQAERLICQNNFTDAVDTYDIAFGILEKPFGKDVHNAALAAQLAGRSNVRDQHLQTIINNSDDLAKVKLKFVNAYMSQEEWQDLMDEQLIDYDPELRREFKDIQDRDQLFRPMYEMYDDTINANRLINLERIIEVTELTGFPSHIELGYTDNLRGQNHDIVLHHTAQRRSYDKSVRDLESILFNAVQAGRFDPDVAIRYMNFQADVDKGSFEVYSTWQYNHSSLPDSLNAKVWFADLSSDEVTAANEMRATWYANSLEEISMKAAYAAQSDVPFIFTCVQHSIANFGDIDAATALMQYEAFTSMMREYK